MSATAFGVTKEGLPVTRYTLESRSGITVGVLDRGAIIQSILVPCPDGPVDVVAGFDDISGYEACDAYLGALVGRHANRLGGAFIEIDGKRWPVTANEGAKQLHGGLHGFDQKMFAAEQPAPNCLVLRCVSPDGEEGFPGEVTLQATYTLSDEGALSLDYQATSTRDTVINLTNHSYFNLNGGGSVLQHRLWLAASRFTPIDADALPTGEIRDVAGTPFDFCTAKQIGADLDACDEQLALGHGYDHNFVLDKVSGELATVAELCGDQTGIRMRCVTTCPGLQLYTANFLQSPPLVKGEKTIAPRETVCLETQYFPNSMNCPAFEKPIVRAGGLYHERTIYEFIK